MTTKLIILDRDGVINQELGRYVTCPGEFVFFDDAPEAIARLHKAGYLVAIATNQAGIARGFYTHEVLANIHCNMLKAVRKVGGDIDRIVYCPSYDDSHPWRKPNHGMLTEILRGYQIDDASRVFFIGDSLRDMVAGDTVGCRLLMVKTGKGAKEYPLLSEQLRRRVVLSDSLSDAVSQVLATT